MIRNIGLIIVLLGLGIVVLQMAMVMPGLSSGSIAPLPTAGIYTMILGLFVTGLGRSNPKKL